MAFSLDKLSGSRRGAKGNQSPLPNRPAHGAMTLFILPSTAAGVTLSPPSATPSPPRRTRRESWRRSARNAARRIRQPVSAKDAELLNQTAHKNTVSSLHKSVTHMLHCVSIRLEVYVYVCMVSNPTLNTSIRSTCMRVQ